MIAGGKRLILAESDIFALIKKTKGPERNLPHVGRFYIIGCDIGILLIGYLAEAFILSANLNDDVTINTEVALL